MILVRLKLDPRPAQERILTRWLWHLTGVYNWTVRKIELDAKNRIFHSRYDIQSLLIGHSTRMGIPMAVLRGTVRTAHTAWENCFQRRTRRPKLKGSRNK